MQTLNRTKQELNEGRAKINDIVAKLEREEVSCTLKNTLNSYKKV